MKIDTRIIPTDHKGKPFRRISINTETLWARVRQLRDQGKDAAALVEEVERECSERFGQPMEGLLAPMDLADCLTYAVEQSEEYNGKAADPKLARAKVLRTLCGEGEVDLTTEEWSIVVRDIRGPAVGGALMLALDELLTASKAAHEAEERRKREEKPLAVAKTEAG